MRLGAPVLDIPDDPAKWAARVRQLGFSAAFCPVGDDLTDAELDRWAQAAADADIVIGEVGAWSNPISSDESIRREAIGRCQRKLAKADRLGARCCVNVAGSRGTTMDGPDPRNYDADTFDLIVESVHKIIDAVRPTRTYYVLETLPWLAPDSPDSYVRLIEAIDRDRFAVHMDPVNLINSPYLYYHNGALIRECFEKLGPQIRCCHAKDIALSDEFTVHLSECAPGTGNLDYATYLRQLDKLDADTPLLVEHLQTQAEYAAACSHIRSVADEVGIRIR